MGLATDPSSPATSVTVAGAAAARESTFDGAAGAIAADGSEGRGRDDLSPVGSREGETAHADKARRRSATPLPVSALTAKPRTLPDGSCRSPGARPVRSILFRTCHLRDISRADLAQHPVDRGDLLVAIRRIGVDHVQQQVSLGRLLERGPEGGDQPVRQVADEAHRVRDEDLGAEDRIRVGRVDDGPGGSMDRGWRTTGRPSVPRACASRLNSVDLPALVYPISDTCGNCPRLRLRRRVARWRSTLCSRSRRRRCLSSIIRRSSSIWRSPGPPRRPMPPRWRSRWDHIRTSRDAWCSSRASSTCSLPSLLRARCEKMSMMSSVRSLTGRFQARSRLRCWTALIGWSNRTTTGAIASSSAPNDSTAPLPI